MLVTKYLMAIIVIILTYHQINGTLYYYTRQGLNYRMKLHKKINAIYTKEVIMTPFKFLVPLTCIVLFILVICPGH